MTTPIAAAAEAATKQLPRKFGNKQVFLPNHVVAFIRPKDKQPPNLATFVVPLKFNKFDLRDYLYHGYNVQVTSVRSFINRQFPKRKFAHHGRIYLPRPQKMMIVELLKPFVWPEPPAKSDLDAFDYATYKKISDQRGSETKKRIDPTKVPLLSRSPLPEYRVKLKESAADMAKRGEWSNEKNNDDEWTEVETDVKV
ncbi:uncharacterized protein B0H64DRAFT_401621 [Chaetomium fimeti]|uniref:Large ribosomal subunit protein uL23m n=1 Tax=Chaetomium fimeti TaxID=1854472 RepID=A0AAE0HE62_9PEZI|nr:hypothetical protein B0H64DRAFT_401621 [Chaetomium fimeti]